MEKIYYDELLNHKVIKKTFMKLGGLLLLNYALSITLPKNELFCSITSIATIAILGNIVIWIPIRYIETTKIKKLVTFYNDCIKTNNCIEVDEDLKSGFIVMSNNIILNKLKLNCEPEFIYDDETKVYKVENTNVIVVNGYFKDNSISRRLKRNYIMVFIDCEYSMCCIDNLICWEKGTYWSKWYKGNELSSNTTDITKC